MLMNVKLKKRMSKHEVNNIIGKYILLNDEIYLGSKHLHTWTCKECKCVFEGMWGNIKKQKSFDCGCIEYNKVECRYKKEVEGGDEYEYIRSFRSGDTLPNGKIVGNRKTYIQIKHTYCGNEYVLQAKSFINEGRRCIYCCKTYENSFAHYIEVELGEPLEKYWDFEKNTVNPYHLYKNHNGKVWIKCTETDYHESYEIACNHFVIGNGCSYCCGKKVHPKDSFGQWLVDNNKFHLWSYKNNEDPFAISMASKKKIWILCNRKDYHNDEGGYQVSCGNYTHGKSCPYCSNRKIHYNDSFGAINSDKVKCWHKDNKISPYEVAPKARAKYKFICNECEHIWESPLYCVSIGVWCPSCNKSKGEKRILSWIKLNNFKYASEVEFKGLVSDIRKPLRYDFYLPNHNTLIEYDGLQHDKWIKSWMSKDAFVKLQRHDMLKDKYAKCNNIRLIRIKEKDFNNIEKILEKELNL